MQIQEWTPQQIEHLRALAFKGFSDKEIAAKINAKFGTSRSRWSVIGKAKQEGIRIACVRPPWTGARIKRLCELAPTGMGVKAIAAAINQEFGTNYTPRAVRQRAYRIGSPIARTIPKNRKRAKARRMWTDQEDQIARAMLAKGASLVMVSHEIYEVTGKYRCDISVRDRAYLKRWPRKKQCRNWTPQEDDEMRRLLAAGLDQQGVADAMGISKRRVKHRMGKLRLTAQPMPEWPEERRQRLADLVLAGLSASKIGAVMGVSKSAVIGQCSRQGWKLALPPGHRTTRHVSLAPVHGASP